MDSRNLVLTGFMGTGKTSVGRLVAERLHREFVDMDELIAAREGAPIAQIFARYGEPHFRACERALCAELSARNSLVIATGGGAMVDPSNRALFENASVICLDASVDDIMLRLNGAQDRPLLSVELGNGMRGQVRELFATRKEAYDQIPAHVDTAGRGIEDVAREIVRRFAGAASPENEPGAANSELTTESAASSLYLRTPGGSHPIQLGSGLLDRVGEILPRAEFAARCAVVTNPTVGALYAARLTESLRAGGFDPIVVEIPDGEEYKTLDTLRGLYDRFVDAHLERRSPVLALGGGVIGDIAGFAAATFLRGVPFVQVPTTLLAMADASIGGKVAVDHPSGKNLIGAYKFPYAVIADPDVLATLPVEEFRAGLAEVIKNAIIGDAALFDELARVPASASIRRGWEPDVIARAIRVKIDLVERDPFESNVRAYLNLGHTFGHAIEKLSHFEMRHGYAVAIGTAIAARLASRLGLCDAVTRERIVDLFNQKSLPTRAPGKFDSGQIVEAMGADKKISGGKMRLILPRAIGHVEIVEDVPNEQLILALEESRGEGGENPPLRDK